MSAVERGVTNLTLTSIERIAGGLGVTPGALVSEADAEFPREDQTSSH
jgi:transcriptional regulator with XRE-family HTH domain